MSEATETRPVKLRDIPVVKRLLENGVVLDGELCFTQYGGGGQHGANILTLVMPSRGVHTLISRTGAQSVVGQFRLKPDGHIAQVSVIAPALLEDGDEDTAWLHILDAMAAEAGRRGAHLLAAEVDEDAPAFRTLRTASYSIYARQEIWGIAFDGLQPPAGDMVELTDASGDDAPEIYALYGSIVPRLVQQVAELPGAGGWVYRRGDRIEGYIAVSEGKTGVYLMPLLHPDVFSEAAAIIAAAVSRVERCKLPIYVRVRRYQDWLDDALLRLGFDLRARQAVMVKHIAAGVRAAAFAPLNHRMEAVTHSAPPPTSGIIES